MTNRNVLGAEGTQHTVYAEKLGLGLGGEKGRGNRFGEIKEVLLKAKSVVLRELSRDSDPSVLNPGETPADVLDVSASDLDRTLCLLLRERDRNKLKAIDEALERIEEGTFGICEDCGDEIPLGRLKVMPFATSCIDCKTKQERRDKQNAPPEENLF